MVCCYLVHEVLNMTENNKVCFEDCKMYFTTTKKYQRQKEKRQLYLTQILQVKDFIIEGLENNFEAKMLYDYLEFKKAVSMPYVTFLRLIRTKIINAQSISSWKFGEKIDKLDELSKKTGSTTETKKEQVKAEKKENKPQLVAPSFSNWDGDSTKFIDKLVGN